MHFSKIQASSMNFLTSVGGLDISKEHLALSGTPILSNTEQHSDKASKNNAQTFLLCHCCAKVVFNLPLTSGSDSVHLCQQAGTLLRKLAAQLSFMPPYQQLLVLACWRQRKVCTRECYLQCFCVGQETSCCKESKVNFSSLPCHGLSSYFLLIPNQF